MKRILTAAALAAAAALPAAAADDGPEARRAAAEAYVKAPANVQMMDQMLAPDQMRAMFMGSMGGADKLNAAQKNILFDFIGDMLSDLRPNMMDLMIDQSAQQFTLAELEALTALYTSPEGVSVMGKMPAFMVAFQTQFNGQVQGYIRDRMPQLVQDIQAAGN